METTERVGVAPLPVSHSSRVEHFDECRSCGRPMMTTGYQLHLMVACPEWGASTADEVRNILISSGVHYLFEVKKGYCEYCSAH